MQILREGRRTCGTRTIVANEKILARGTCCCSRIFCPTKLALWRKTYMTLICPFYKPSSQQPIKESKGGRNEHSLTDPTSYSNNEVLEGARKHQYKFELPYIRTAWLALDCSAHSCFYVIETSSIVWYLKCDNCRRSGVVKRSFRSDEYWHFIS
jgi:hypothetical protein